MPGCDFPGCGKTSHAYDYYKDESKKYSFHRIPDSQREKVSEIINLPAEKRHKTHIFICDSHIIPGSFMIKNKKRNLRTDIPFCDLVIPWGSEFVASPGRSAPATASADNSQLHSNASFAADESYLSHTMDDEDMTEPSSEEQMVTTAPAPAPTTTTTLHRSPQQKRKRKSFPSIKLKAFQSPNRSMQVHSPPTAHAATSLPAGPGVGQDEIKQSKARAITAELKAKEAERQSRELDDALSRTRTHFMTESEAKDKEISTLKKQLQQVIAENKALAEANKSLSVDLNVYRKLIQLESKAAAATKHPRSPGDSPVRKHWRGMRESSTDVDLPDDEPEDSNASNASIQCKKESSSNGSLEEIKKWLKSNKKC